MLRRPPRCGEVAEEAATAARELVLLRPASPVAAPLAAVIAVGAGGGLRWSCCDEKEAPPTKVLPRLLGLPPDVGDCSRDCSGEPEPETPPAPIAAAWWWAAMIERVDWRSLRSAPAEAPRLGGARLRNVRKSSSWGIAEGEAVPSLALPLALPLPPPRLLLLPSF